LPRTSTLVYCENSLIANSFITLAPGRTFDTQNVSVFVINQTLRLVHLI